MLNNENSIIVRLYCIYVSLLQLGYVAKREVHYCGVMLHVGNLIVPPL